MIDRIGVAGERGLHDQALDVDVGAVECGQLRRQIADGGRLDAAGVDQAGHLHAAAGRQVVDQPMLGTFPAILAGLLVSMASMMAEPYSCERTVGNSPATISS